MQQAVEDKREQLAKGIGTELEEATKEGDEAMEHMMAATKAMKRQQTPIIDSPRDCQGGQRTREQTARKQS